MSLILTVLFFVIFLAIVFWIMSRLPIPEPWKSVLMGVIALIALFVLAGHLGFVKL